MQFWNYYENKQRGTKDFPIEFHHVDSNHPRYDMPYHWHMEYEIIRILKGEFKISIDDKTFDGKENDIFIIRDSVLHGGTAKDCIYECLVLDINTLLKYNPTCRHYLQFLTSSSVTILPYIDSTDHSTLKEIVWSLFDEFYKNRKGHELFVLGYLYQMMAQIYHENLFYNEDSYMSKDRKRIQQFKKVFDYIEEHFSEVITVDDLSDVAEMSPRYFYRIFYSLTHRSPIDYLNYYRIERACNYLISTDLPITEISYQCGFNDLSYFIKTFKRYKGIPPKKYQLAEGMNQVIDTNNI